MHQQLYLSYSATADLGSLGERGDLEGPAGKEGWHGPRGVSDGLIEKLFEKVPDVHVNLTRVLLTILTITVRRETFRPAARPAVHARPHGASLFGSELPSLWVSLEQVSRHIAREISKPESTCERREG